MIRTEKITVDDADKITQVIAAVGVHLYDLRIPWPADSSFVNTQLLACHISGCALDLDKLLASDRDSMIHDVFGISMFFRLGEGTLGGSFWPRSAIKPRAEKPSVHDTCTDWDSITSRQLSLLLKLEDFAATGGTFFLDTLVPDQVEFVEQWTKDGAIEFGKIPSGTTTRWGTHWVKLPNDALAVAHAGRKARAERIWDSWHKPTEHESS